MNKLAAQAQLKQRRFLPRARVALRRFHRDQFGGAYTLSYVMVIPFLMFCVALIVESALMMSARLGVNYAAYAAARSASVSSSTRSWGEVVDLAELAAEQAMLPFASGSTSGSKSSTSKLPVDEVIAAHEDWSNEPVSGGYLRSKAGDLAKRISVEISSAPTSWDSDLEATVIYKYPFHVPGIGQLLGQREGDTFVFPLAGTAVLHNEAPQNSEQDLGIGYGVQTN